MARVKPLTDTQCKNLKPKEKEYKVADGDGLYLHVTPTGSKIWRMRVVIDGKQTTKGIGKYPAVSLRDARAHVESARDSLATGVNPFEKNTGAMTFNSLVEEFFKHNDHLSPKYIKEQKGLIENNFYSFIGDMGIAEVSTSHLISAFKRMNDRGVSILAKKAGSQINRVFKYAVTLQYIDKNPMSDIDLGVLVKNKKSENFAHITDQNEFADLLKAIDEYSGDHSTRLALKLAPYAFVRPFNIRHMEWVEIDFDKKLWTIEADKMKMGRDHIVPLTDSMIDIIRQNEGNGSRFVFSSSWSKSKPMSENTLNVALKRLGYGGIMTSHGFRHTASTLLHENSHIHKIGSDVIEIQLAHVDGSVRGVYNKAIYMEERIRLMQWWSDKIDELRES